jgi:hypothetical protein
MATGEAWKTIPGALGGAAPPQITTARNRCRQNRARRLQSRSLMKSEFIQSRPASKRNRWLPTRKSRTRSRRPISARVKDKRSVVRSIEATIWQIHHLAEMPNVRAEVVSVARTDKPKCAIVTRPSGGRFGWSSRESDFDFVDNSLRCDYDLRNNGLR